MGSDVEEEKKSTPAKPLVRKRFPLTVEQVSDLVLGAKEVEQGGVQHIESLDQSPIVRVPGGAGAWQYQHKRSCGYRVYVMTEKGFGEATSDDLFKAVELAFAAAKIPVPKAIADHLAEIRAKAKN